ncbi:MAG: fibronectin type III domain-containing protein [Treponema sp.]|nr:fibronectin type III domain-containing protein [Treponema sp.]
MKHKPIAILVLYCFFLLYGRAYGLGERTLVIGADSSWDMLETRQGLSEAPNIRPQPVMLLSSAVYNDRFPGSSGALLDLALSFDEAHPLSYTDSMGRYRVDPSFDTAAAPRPLSRIGSGAALFNGRTQDQSFTIRPGRNALFASHNHVRDFTIEFWLFPQNLQNGEIIMSLVSATVAAAPSLRQGVSGSIEEQSIHCSIERNRVHWSFDDFFFSPGGESRMSLTLVGPVLLPRTWSHHLIRFDADLGLLEYLVDGRVEAISYATSTGGEGGEVFSPRIGEDSRITLGSYFTGMLDEFRIYRGFVEPASLTSYAPRAGRLETRPLDLGHSFSRIQRIDAFGGWTSSSQGLQNEYAGSGPLRFSDHAEIVFYYRCGANPFLLRDAPWIPIQSGRDLTGIRGRYIQVAAEFYPGIDGESSPYLSEIRIVYHGAEPPPPPTQVFAVPMDGAVELSWRAVPSRDLQGYVVYYGTTRGEYFGVHAIIESMVRPSPIDVGNRTSIRIEGLQNGTLYHFTVAAYGESDPLHPEPGEFSREVSARPLRNLALEADPPRQGYGP